MFKSSPLASALQGSKNRSKIISESPKRTVIAESPINYSKIIDQLSIVGQSYIFDIDFPTLKLDHFSQPIQEFHTVSTPFESMHDFIDIIHPEDIDFVKDAEEKIKEILTNKIVENTFDFKANFCFRMLDKTGNYALYNHQYFYTKLDDNGKYSESKIIHTNVNDYGKQNPYTVFVSGIKSKFGIYLYDFRTRELTVIDDIKPLSSREMEILTYYVKNIQISEIAEKLKLSENTIVVHKKNIFNKLHLKRNRVTQLDSLHYLFY